MRLGAAGALELPGRAGARTQQRGPRSGTRAARGARGLRLSAAPLIRHLGRVPYEPTWRAMQRFTDERGAATPDEIWLLKHPPVFTLGLNAKREHVLAPGDIPVMQT